MADTETLVIAFAGPGDSSPENTAKLLDSELPNELENVYVPDRILRAHEGLKSVVIWLEDEIGDEGKGYQAVPRKSLLKSLADTDAERKWLIYLPPEDLTENDTDLIREAWEMGFEVKNLSEGFDDLILEEETKEPGNDAEAAEVNAETSTKRRRGKSRGTTRSAAVEEDNEAQATIETEVAAQSVTRLAYETMQKADPCSLLGAAVYTHVRDMLVADGYLAAPKPEVYPAWCDDDGNYRPRLGRGRGRKGETAVDLSLEEVSGIEGLLAEFEEAQA